MLHTHVPEPAVLVLPVGHAWQGAMPLVANVLASHTDRAARAPVLAPHTRVSVLLRAGGGRPLLEPVQLSPVVLDWPAGQAGAVRARPWFRRKGDAHVSVPTPELSPTASQPPRAQEHCEAPLR